MRRARIVVSLAVAVAVPGCGRAQPEPVAGVPAAAEARDLGIRYLANEGVLLSLPEGLF